MLGVARAPRRAVRRRARSLGMARRVSRYLRDSTWQRKPPADSLDRNTARRARTFYAGGFEETHVAAGDRVTVRQRTRVTDNVVLVQERVRSGTELQAASETVEYWHRDHLGSGGRGKPLRFRRHAVRAPRQWRADDAHRDRGGDRQGERHAAQDHAARDIGRSRALHGRPAAGKRLASASFCTATRPMPSEFCGFDKRKWARNPHDLGKRPIHARCHRPGFG